MFIPSYYSLAQTAWMKEDNSHAPIIIALSFWLLWLDRDKIFLTPAKPAVGTAWVVLLIGVSCNPAIRLNSWDRAVLPLPFGRGAVVWDVDAFPEGLSTDEVTQRWTDRLTAVEARADAITGLERV